MKITLELNENLEMRTIFEGKVTYPMIFGMLKTALARAELDFRCQILDEQHAARKTAKRKSAAKKAGIK